MVALRLPEWPEHDKVIHAAASGTHTGMSESYRPLRVSLELLPHAWMSKQTYNICTEKEEM